VAAQQWLEAGLFSESLLVALVVFAGDAVQMRQCKIVDSV